MRTLLMCSALSLLAAAGCGKEDDDDDGGNGNGDGAGGTAAGCGTESAPDTLVLSDVTPAAGADVPAGPVVHAFTVVGAVTGPGLFTQIAFLPGATHEAGTLTPAQVRVAATQSGQDVRYTAEAVEWSADGHVELSVPVKHKGADGCYYVFPSPLFEYDVVPNPSM